MHIGPIDPANNQLRCSNMRLDKTKHITIHNHAKCPKMKQAKYHMARLQKIRMDLRKKNKNKKKRSQRHFRIKQ